MGLLEALQKYIDAEEAKDPEIIDGTNIKDVLDVVDLSIAHSPVIPFRAPDHVSPAESLRGAVEAIETEGGGYILRDRIKTAEHLQRTTTMGTDIHSIAQVQVDGKWRTVAVGIGGDPRSYNMFAMLADVRNGYGFAGIKTSDPFPVIHEPRGLPSDLALNEDGDSLTIKSEDLLLSWDYGADALGSKVLKVQLWMGDHSHSWCLLSELESFVERIASKHQSTLYGVIDRTEYDAAKKEGRQFKDWRGDVYGPNVVKATEAEYAIKPDSITHVSVEWKESALECSRLGSIMEALREIAAVCNVPPDSVRYVYGFDS